VNSSTGKVVGAVIAASFLPIGYLICVIGQIIYHWVPGIGVDTRARRSAQVRFEQDSMLEWKQETFTIFQITTTKAFTFDQMRFTLEWMSRRMDMVVINGAIILASILAFWSASVFPWVLGEHSQFHLGWFVFASAISVIVFGVSVFSWWTLTSQLVKVETKLFKSFISL
jgi:hypothetical protein